MPRFIHYLAVLFLIIGAISCRQNIKTEKEEVAYWNDKFIDTAYRMLYKDKDTTRAIRFYDSSFRSAGKNNIFLKSSRLVLLANYHYFFTGDNNAVAKYTDSALGMMAEPEQQDRYPRFHVANLLFGGNIAYRLNQYSKANEYYFKAKKLGDTHLQPYERAPFYYCIAMVLYRQQNYLESLHYFVQAYDLQETSAQQTTANILQQQEIQSNIGLCYTQLKKYDSAYFHFDKALQIAEHYKDSLGPAVMDKIYGVIYGHKGQIALIKGQFDEAEQLLQKSIVLNDREGYETEHARRMKLQLSKVYYRKNEFTSMAVMLQDLEPFLQSSDTRTQMEWKRLKATYFEKTGQADSALGYFKSYHLLQDSVADEQTRLMAADVARQLLEKEQELQIAILTKDQHITLISLAVTIVFSCMAVTILYLIYQNYCRSKKSLAVSLALNEEIRRQKSAREEEAKQRHKLITEAVIRAQENERSLIGLELHDNINQVLTTVKLHNEMLLEGIGDPKVILPRTLRYLQSCINEIRGLSKRLSAPTLGKISLEDSVKDLIESINLTSKVKISQQISGFGSDPLSQELHIGIYRILQEQLNNVLKHADASEVKISLQRTGTSIHLSITDNGKGFEVGNSRNGIGLVNMQTRAENMSGTFEVHSHPGKGCRIEVVVPCFPAPCSN